jgi:hypothetical protein
MTEIGILAAILVALMVILLKQRNELKRWDDER